MPPMLGDLRPLVLADLSWVLDLAGHRRQQIAGYAPRFWRPAPDARDRQRLFLGHQIQDQAVVSLRTDHGFVVAAPRAGLLVVDDMALDDDARWTDDGNRLLRAVLRRGATRVVCPVPEPPRQQAALAAGLVLAESWWHRDLPGTAAPAMTTGEDPVLRVAGASGRLVEAPPVYAPGGPVLLALQVDSRGALAALESAAAAVGAVVSVVPRRPGQPDDLLTAAGYRRTTDFFVSHR